MPYHWTNNGGTLWTALASRIYELHALPAKPSNGDAPGWHWNVSRAASGEMDSRYGFSHEDGPCETLELAQRAAEISFEAGPVNVGDWTHRNWKEDDDAPQTH